MRHYLSVVLVGSVVLGGCGSDDKHGGLPDGPTAPTDAPSVDVPGQPGSPVALTVMRNGMPQAGVHTYFLNADSSVVATLDTDASGTVSAVMAAGGSVTAINPFPPIPPAPQAVALADNDLRTFMGVKPGDHLVLTQNDDHNIDFTLNAPASGMASDPATTYDVLTSCGTGSIFSGGGGGGSGSPDPGGPMTLSNCNGTADILIIARGSNADGQPTVSALYHPDAPLTENGTVNLTDDTYQSLGNVSLSYTNLPVNFLQVSHTLVTAHGAFQPFQGSADVTDGEASVDLSEPTIAGATGIVDTQVVVRGRHHVVDRAAVAATYMLDATGLLLRDLFDEPFYNPATKRVSWHEDSTGAVPDLTTTCIDVFGAQRNWQWAIAAPYAPGGELIFPTLPTDIADWAPLPTDGFRVQGLMNAKVPGGYDAVRAHVHDVVNAADYASAMGHAVTVETQASIGELGTPRSRKLRAAHR